MTWGIANAARCFWAAGRRNESAVLEWIIIACYKDASIESLRNLILLSSLLPQWSPFSLPLSPSLPGPPSPDLFFVLYLTPLPLAYAGYPSLDPRAERPSARCTREGRTSRPEKRRRSGFFRSRLLRCGAGCAVWDLRNGARAELCGNGFCR